MIGLLQRVKFARVDVDGECIGEIDQGLLVLVGVEQGDTADTAQRLTAKLLNYRVFTDEQGRMNHSLQDIDGGLLLVPQFTLLADTTRGNRPGFSRAADPATGESLFDKLLDYARSAHSQVAAGKFGADMQVNLCNDGPVTLSLRIPPG